MKNSHCQSTMFPHSEVYTLPRMSLDGKTQTRVVHFLMDKQRNSIILYVVRLFREKVVVLMKIN
jgi:hypothetical protein